MIGDKVIIVIPQARDAISTTGVVTGIGGVLVQVEIDAGILPLGSTIAYRHIDQVHTT